MPNNGTLILRLLFESDTEIKIASQPHSDDWKRYAKWLEKLILKEPKGEMIEKIHESWERIRNTIEVLKEEVLKG